MASDISAIDIINQPLTLPCGLVLPNRLVKCPMQETLAEAPFFDPPIDTFENLYKEWATAQYGLIITGQVQIDIRFLSIKGDVVSHSESLEEPHFSRWKRWAQIAKSAGTPCIVQLAHPGRMSAAGAGIRPAELQTMCPSSVPVKLGDTWLDKLALEKVLGTPKEMTIEEIDQVVGMWVHGARVAKEAGFDGVQLHGAHGFLLSQFLSPHTNRRTDDYGGTPEKRIRLLKRLVAEIRDICPPPFCVSVKLNSADYMENGGLQQEEGLEQVRWLLECGQVDFVEISGGNAENKTSKLHSEFFQLMGKSDLLTSDVLDSFGTKTMSQAPVRSSTRIREAFFTEFADKVQAMGLPVPIQLSGGFRSRTGMADAIEAGTCQLIGLGRAAVLEPSLPSTVLLNSSLPDERALARSHIVRGQWFARMIPVKVIGSGLGIQFFYHNMRRLGHGLESDPDLSIPKMLLVDAVETLRSGMKTSLGRVIAGLAGWWGQSGGVQKVD